MRENPAYHSCAHDWVEALRAKGLRATAQRVAVLDYLHHHPHADVDTVFQAVRGALPTMSPQGVHVIVHDLTREGLIRRISPPDSTSARYETRIADNHHHIQCIVCGRIEDVDCVIGHAPCLDPSHTHGMRIVEASIVFRGICHTCEPQTDEPSDQQRKESP